MKIDRISYQKIFPTGMMYLNHKIGVEIQVEENDDWQECFELAKRMVEKWNQETNPSMAATMEYMKPNEDAGEFSFNQKTGTITLDKPIGITIDDINSCQDKIVLETYKFLIKGKPELEQAYLKKLREFI